MRPLKDGQVQDLLGRHQLHLMAGPMTQITRVPGAEGIPCRPAPLIHLHAHPPFMALLRPAFIRLIAQVGLEHLQRQRHP